MAAVQSDTGYRLSYLKTTRSALVGTLISVVLLVASLQFLRPPAVHAVVVLLALGLLFFMIVLAGGLVVLYRDKCDRQRKPDVFHLLFNRIPRRSDHGWRRWIRSLLPSTLCPGDCVRVRGLEEIRRTLDGAGKMNGLPFMPEMLAFCGKTYLVDRRIEKINDWIGGSKLRRVEGVVSLVDVRCAGTSHGGCQAACQILWNEQWLQRESVSRRNTIPENKAGDEPKEEAAEGHSLAELLAAQASQTMRRNGMTLEKYMCQITELLHVSRPMRTWDLRQDVRPLLVGNIGLRGFLVALLTATFNKVQALRFGCGYPVMATQLDHGPTPVECLNLVPGEFVRVRSKEEIGRTLANSHNRGMWFGKETARHCGRQYRVRCRVDRIIDERSGEMVNLKTPAIILDGVTGTGELVRFSPQNDYVFWRENWLRRVDQAGEM